MRRRSDYPVYLALRVLLALTLVLPRRAARGLGALLGRFARTLGMRRRVTDDNLAIAFPELPAVARAELGRAVYAHFGRMTVDSMRLSAKGPTALVPLVQESGGIRLFEELVKRGKGVIVLTGHIGNWELAGSYLAARGLEVAAVVKPPSNPYVARQAEDVRRRLGMQTIAMPEAKSGVIAALARNKVVALVADQGALRSATRAPFFGRLTRMASGPGLFAALSGAPVVFGAFIALPDGRYDLTVELLEEGAVGDLRETSQRIATAYLARLEAAVRRAPEQYLWSHRLWRDEPPAEVAASARAG
ncbi:MAG: lysophospholipid acyltransferase family protein [Gemmatimonadales bacterium]